MDGSSHEGESLSVKQIDGSNITGQFISPIKWTVHPGRTRPKQITIYKTGEIGRTR